MNTREAGFTYVELMGGMVVFVVGMLAFAGTFTSSIRLARSTQEAEVSNAAMQSVLDVLRNTRLADLPIAIGDGAGASFFVCETDGAVTFIDDLEGLVVDSETVTLGEVEFFTDEGSVPISFGPVGDGFDLNANGVIDSVAVSDFVVLPTRVTVFHADRDAVFEVLLASVGR